MALRRAADYENHQISYDDKTFHFHIAGPAFPETPGSAKSFEDAKERINEAIRRQQAEKRAEKKIKISVLGDDGERRVISGINPRTGKTNGAADRDFFPDLPWLGLALEELKLLRAAQTEIEAKIRRFRIDSNRGYWSGIRSSGYDAAIDRLVQEIADKTTAAKEAPRLAAETPETKTKRILRAQAKAAER